MKQSCWDAGRHWHPKIRDCVCPQMRIAGMGSYTQIIPRSAWLGYLRGNIPSPSSQNPTLPFCGGRHGQTGKKRWWHDVQRVAGETPRWKSCTICTENVQGYLGINSILFSWHRLVNTNNKASSCNSFTALKYQHQLRQYWPIFSFSPANQKCHGFILTND